MFNSIKTVLPSFDGNPNAPEAKEVKEKPFQEQNLFQGFLNFGSKPEDVPAINLNYQISEASVSCNGFCFPITFCLRGKL